MSEADLSGARMVRTQRTSAGSLAQQPAPDDGWLQVETVLTKVLRVPVQTLRACGGHLLQLTSCALQVYAVGSNFSGQPAASAGLERLPRLALRPLQRQVPTSRTPWWTAPTLASRT